MCYNSKNMNLNECEGVVYLTFPSFERFDYIHHAFSTRMGGVSQNEYASMNLNFGRGDPDENVTENFRRFAMPQVLTSIRWLPLHRTITPAFAVLPLKIMVRESGNQKICKVWTA